MRRSIRSRLNDVLCAIDGAVATIGDADYDTFRRAFHIARTLERCIEIVSEATRHIPEDLKARYPHIAWRQVAAIGTCCDTTTTLSTIGSFGKSQLFTLQCCARPFWTCNRNCPMISKFALPTSRSPDEREARNPGSSDPACRFAHTKLRNSSPRSWHFGCSCCRSYRVMR